MCTTLDWSYVLELHIGLTCGNVARGNVKPDVQFCTRRACNLEYEYQFVCVTCDIVGIIVDFEFHPTRVSSLSYRCSGCIISCNWFAIGSCVIILCPCIYCIVSDSQFTHDCVIRLFVIAVLLVRAHRPCFRVAVAHMIGGANSYARVRPCRSCLIVVVLSSLIRFFVLFAFSDRVVVPVAQACANDRQQVFNKSFATSLSMFRLHLVIVLLVRGFTVVLLKLRYHFANL